MTSRLKKVPHAAEQDRPDVAAARNALKTSRPALQSSRLVFIDETAVTTKMTRLYGRAGGCATGREGAQRPLEDPELVAAPRLDGVTVPCSVKLKAAARDGRP